MISIHHPAPRAETGSPVSAVMMVLASVALLAVAAWWGSGLAVPTESSVETPMFTDGEYVEARMAVMTMSESFRDVAAGLDEGAASRDPLGARLAADWAVASDRLSDFFGPRRATNQTAVIAELDEVVSGAERALRGGTAGSAVEIEMAVTEAIGRLSDLAATVTAIEETERGIATATLEAAAITAVSDLALFAGQLALVAVVAALGMIGVARGVDLAANHTAGSWAPRTWPAGWTPAWAGRMASTLSGVRRIVVATLVRLTMI